MNQSKLMWSAVWLLSAIAITAQAQEGQGDVVYVPTPQIVVNEMLEMAHVGPGDYIIDLGSGDGRIVITAAKKYGAQGYGVDLDKYLLKVANENAKKEGVADRAQFVERNLFETNLGTATVITSYLLPEMNIKLRPKILALKPGTRVVGHDYHMGEWLPDDQKTIPVPEKQVGNPGVSYIYLWVVPAKIAGAWQSRIKSATGEAQYDFTFDQLFQEITGTLRVNQQTTKFNTKVKGEEVSFVVLPKMGERVVRHEFSGRIKGDVIDGTVKIGEGASQRVVPWNAKLTKRGQVRKPADDSAGA
ncbi:MAG TPA: class I SAM-dependent methyltransferase [Burkholderiales bacterium]|nr:class I SAM-dependent methyltransferase [Burkholderiales bacterium]